MPLLHIADPTAERVNAVGFKTVGLLGTAFTMEHAFSKSDAPSSASNRDVVWLSSHWRVLLSSVS
ncbi:aspartate/glutamate racemase [Sphingomonas insulae]|uniref:hypothetical protein n=1 Tax=Sphingomonas insulae TaxID=424800 RepID=UPI001FBAA392|nr:hypothetical protein [Sphingomonas insulae]NIJ31572.1 aspartate/glutamate racemase [Sphingomonas insulae]